MPTYQYLCTECGGQLEAVQKFTDDALTVHEDCGGRLRKVFSPVGIVFKGSGFYRTDSRGSGSPGSSSSGNGSSPAADSPASSGSPAKAGADSAAAPAAASTSSSSSSSTASAGSASGAKVA
ncbi:MAG TPA: FmdB family zinc ribbon protein [Trebonia sp.]